MWLVVVDTTHIQPYIFGSNRLRENIGASYLVATATGDWAFAAVKAVAADAHNVGNENTVLDNKRIEDGLKAEVLYAGGGNFVVLFDEKARAQAFTSRLSIHVLQQAPGLQLVLAQQEMKWHEDVLRDRLNEVLHDLTVQKRNRAWPAPLLGLGVTAACNSTGLPATGMAQGISGEPGYLASDEILAKLDVARPQHSSISMADQRLQRTRKLAEEYRYPSDFEDLGATAGEYSHIAIVHADGNGMGQRIREIGADYATIEKNREFVQALRRFSLNVQRAAEQALKAIIAMLQPLNKDGGKCIIHKPAKDVLIQIKLARKDGRYFIPFRPLVFGGDDLTFVCDGRLGVALAVAYLLAFEHYTALYHLGKDGGGLSACAGIAIVKSHYPFARAYTLATELTSSAKSYRAEQKISGSCLDWHFALSGLGSSIKEIREREYTTERGSLTLRPVTLRANPQHAQQAWPVIWDGIRAFQGEAWAQRRNKIKALRDALRAGPEAVKHFLAAFNDHALLPPVLPGMLSWQQMGWQGDFCGYFDAIELADWFIPLEGAFHGTPATAPAPGK